MIKKYIFGNMRDYLLITAGSLLTALGLNLFLVPNSIAAGGASGLGTVLYLGFGIPVSAVVLGVNILLFALGYRYLPVSVLVRTVFATVMLSVFIEVFDFFDYSVPLVNDVENLRSSVTIKCGCASAIFVYVCDESVHIHFCISNMVKQSGVRNLTVCVIV